MIEETVQKHSSPSLGKVGPHLRHSFNENPFLGPFFYGFHTERGSKSMRIEERNHFGAVRSSYMKNKKTVQYFSFQKIGEIQSVNWQIER